MWRLAISELANRSVYKGQKILFMGTIKVSVKDIFVKGRRVPSAYVSSSTKPIFRSESARYVLFVQMSKEMWDFDSEGTGEIMFNKVINGFLPELFKRWENMNARHLVSIVLFTRMEYDTDVAPGNLRSLLATESFGMHPEYPPYKDFYRVVVSDMASGEWTSILLQLKREFKVFLRDVSVVRGPRKAESAPTVQKRHLAALDHSGTVIAGNASVAVRGNILEAITLACSQFSYDHIDRDLVRTGVSIVVITPGTGVFEVDYNMLALTTETVTGNGIGIDLVCLSHMPLHSVPLFKHRIPENVSKFKVSSSPVSTPLANDVAFGNYPNSVSATSPSESHLNGSTTFAAYNSTWSAAALGECSYALPHWIDVSFWTAQERGCFKSRKGEGRADLLSRPRFGIDKTFKPRVRMYELQMMGVMENDMSNISIPHLHKDSLYTKYTSNPYVKSELLNLKKHPNIPTENSKQPSQLPKDALQWMDKYDDAVFHSPAWRREAEHEAKLKSLGEERKGSQDRLLEPPSILQTSPNDLHGFLKRSEVPLGAAYFDRKMKEGGGSKDRAGVGKTTTGNGSATLGQSMLKPTRLSRQISFGPRGIGTVAPKATARTEISSEYAMPGPSVTRGFLDASSSSGSSVTLSSQAGSTFRGQAKGVRPENRSDHSSTNLSNALVNNGTATQPSRPIAIKIAMKQRSTAQETRAKTNLDAAPRDSELGKRQIGEFSTSHTTTSSSVTGLPSDFAKKSNAVVDASRSSPTRALSPWLTILNPSNPRRSRVDLAAQLGRWQHVYPHRLRTSAVRWKSLCSPAAVPLTTEDFPTAEELARDYQENPYRIAQNDDDELAEMPKSMEGFLKELVAFRLSRGFQIVVGSNVAHSTGQSAMQPENILDSGFITEKGINVYLSTGTTIHQIHCTDCSEVEIKRYVRKPWLNGMSANTRTAPVVYTPAIRTILAEDYIDRHIVFRAIKEEDNWNHVDNFIAGYKEQFTDQLPFWRARFVLIPVDPSSSVRRPLHSLNEDSPEEIRLEGIRKLTQMWQRYRYVPPNERRYQAPTRKRKDTNPLDIMYQTRNPSVVVAAELDSSSLAESDTSGKPTQLLPDTDLFQRSNLSLSTLAQTIQGEKGIRMMDRRWHWRHHDNCFIGFELTSWLLQNFRDVDTRDEAVELGNYLMKNGLFQHVEKRHNFRDGNYFYQIASDFRTPRPESRSGWFGTRKSEKSVPSTPMSENAFKDFPNLERPGSRSKTEDDQSTHDASTPTGGPRKSLEVALSKVMRYDVDHRKKSYRPEMINLHYDRLHNPDNCYHIRIDWMNVTSKLIEDAIVSWATCAEKYGLRLVEVPIGEACSISDTHPFRAPYTVKLASQAPTKQPHAYFDTTSFSPQVKTERHFYQKAILRRFDFVLDLEAAKDFPEDVIVRYSWGRPDYRFPQYVHRSGVLLAQVTDDGDFLLLANSLFNTRSAAAKDTAKSDKANYDRRVGPGPGPAVLDRLSPFSSPLVRATPDVLGGALAHSDISATCLTPEKIKLDFESFCANVGALERFYDDVLTRSSSPNPNTPFLDTTIPAIGLPPSLSIQGVSSSLQVEAIANAIHKGIADDQNPGADSVGKL